MVRLLSLRAVALCASLSLTGCYTGPTGSELSQAVADQMSTVGGEWISRTPLGRQPAENQIDLNLRLHQDRENVFGSGTMKEAAASDRVPITVTGMFRTANRRLSLRFHGMVYEGMPVAGEFAGSYDNVVAMDGPLRVTREGLDRQIPMTLHRQTFE